MGGRNENRSRLSNDMENRSGKRQQKKPTKDNMVLQHKKWQAVEHRRALTAQKHEAHSYKHNVLVNRAHFSSQSFNFFPKSIFKTTKVVLKVFSLKIQ